MFRPVMFCLNWGKSWEDASCFGIVRTFEPELWVEVRVDNPQV